MEQTGPMCQCPSLPLPPPSPPRPPEAPSTSSWKPWAMAPVGIPAPAAASGPPVQTPPPPPPGGGDFWSNTKKPDTLPAPGLANDIQYLCRPSISIHRRPPPAVELDHLGRDCCTARGHLHGRGGVSAGRGVSEGGKFLPPGGGHNSERACGVFRGPPQLYAAGASLLAGTASALKRIADIAFCS